MLPRANRLKTNFEFSKAKRFGEKIQSENFYLYCLKIDKSPFKVGVVVSKHFSKKAVDRNRAKRIIIEILWPLLPAFKDNFWVVIYPKRELLNKKNEEIVAEVNKILPNLPFAG